jgi:hypothetical protein
VLESEPLHNKADTEGKGHEAEVEARQVRHASTAKGAREVLASKCESAFIFISSPRKDVQNGKEAKEGERRKKAKKNRAA